MPTAFVLDLECQRDGAIYGFTGQHAFRFWQRTWEEAAEEAGISGAASATKRAFTISPLMGISEMRRRRTPMLAGDTALLRLTSLNDTVTNVIDRHLLRLVGKVVDLGGIPWKIRSVLGPESDSPHTGGVTYSKLREQNKIWHPVPQEDWKLELTTPTAVQLDNGVYLPFPLPSTTLYLWMESWARFAPSTMAFVSEDVKVLVDKIAPRLELNRYTLKAIGASLSLGQDYPEAGCIGKLVLSATGLGKSELEIVSTMIDFSIFCGTGIYTELGLGQTRVNRPQ